jgi:transposase-like protein
MKRITPEARELAFRLYAENGGRDIPKVLERLRRNHGVDITEQTLHEWKRQGGWKERMEQSLEGRREFHDRELVGLEERMMGRLIRQIEKYELYMQAPHVDNQASFAYTNMIRTAIELAGRIRPEKRTDPEEMRRIADEILETDYGIKRR